MRLQFRAIPRFYGVWGIAMPLCIWLAVAYRLGADHGLRAGLMVLLAGMSAGVAFVLLARKP